MTNIDPTALRKALSAENTSAIFSYYCDGHLNYHFEYDGHTYEFPIDTVENGHGPNGTATYIRLSDDLGTTPFKAIMPAKELWRWIVNAIKSEELIRLR